MQKRLVVEDLCLREWAHGFRGFGALAVCWARPSRALTRARRGGLPGPASASDEARALSRHAGRGSRARPNEPRGLGRARRANLSSRALQRQENRETSRGDRSRGRGGAMPASEQAGRSMGQSTRGKSPTLPPPAMTSTRSAPRRVFARRRGVHIERRDAKIVARRRGAAREREPAPKRHPHRLGPDEARVPAPHARARTRPGPPRALVHEQVGRRRRRGRADPVDGKRRRPPRLRAPAPDPPAPAVGTRTTTSHTGSRRRRTSSRRSSARSHRSTRASATFSSRRSPSSAASAAASLACARATNSPRCSTDSGPA